MNRRRRPGPLALAGLAVLGACGYSVGFADHAAPGRTVAVGVVDNRSFRQRIEAPLTRSVLEQLTTHSGMRPASPATADTLLELVLADVTGRSLVGPGAGLPVREGALDFAVDIRLVDRRSAALLREARVVDRAEFRGPVGETEASATAEAVEDLARKIVLALEADF